MLQSFLSWKGDERIWLLLSSVVQFLSSHIYIHTYINILCLFLNVSGVCVYTYKVRNTSIQEGSISPFPLPCCSLKNHFHLKNNHFYFHIYICTQMQTRYISISPSCLEGTPWQRQQQLKSAALCCFLYHSSSSFFISTQKQIPIKISSTFLFSSCLICLISFA